MTIDPKFTTGYGWTDAAVKFDTGDFEKQLKKVCDNAAKKGAELILQEGKRFIQQHAKHPTGKLASEIKLKKSKYKGGGWAVEAQGPNNYDKFYATFVELGSVKNPRPVPFLRNPLAANKHKIIDLFEGILK